jgi:hypothetical protein
MHHLLLALILLGLTSCAAPFATQQNGQATEEPEPVAQQAAYDEQHSAEAAPSSDLNGDFDHTVLKAPYRLNRDNIIRLAFAKSPSVTAAREDMIATQHGLEEFRFNLSRLEPFMEASSDVADFPNRLGAFGATAEAVVGIEKETFEGALMRVEVGGAYSNFEFDRVLAGGDEHQEAGGGLVRGRLEQPFFGSRRRQNRVIAQAFQESAARKGQLDYLSSYREDVDDALHYYNQVNYYEQLVGIYDKYLGELATLMTSPEVKDEDRGRIESVKNSAERSRDSYEEDRREGITYLLASLGIDHNEEFVFEPADPYTQSPFAIDETDSEGLEKLIERARKNNPTFNVLNDAIDNAQLQRRQAVDGHYDVTTFLEGTLFPLGSESFDDRLDGWIVGGGVTVRLNDHRVLQSTRLKAEAEIRQFEAQLRQEEIIMRRRITIETRGLVENNRRRAKLRTALEQGQRVYEDRTRSYYAGEVNIDQLLDARSVVTSTESSLASNLYGVRSRERRLTGALGRIYDVVGLQFEASGEGSADSI